MTRPLAYISAPWGTDALENATNAANYCRQAYEEALPESKDDIVIYGLTRNDRPNQKVKALTVNDVLHFPDLTHSKIEVLLEILENGMVRNDEGFDPLPYYETVDLFCDVHYQNQTEDFEGAE